MVFFRDLSASALKSFLGFDGILDEASLELYRMEKIYDSQDFAVDEAFSYLEG
jgi:hypothetical protein